MIPREHLRIAPRLVRTMVLALAVIAMGHLPVAAQQPNSIVLLDISGSMEKEHGAAFLRYSRGHDQGKSQMQELVRELGTALDRHCKCPVLLGQFSSSREPAPVTEALRGAQLAEHTPARAPGMDTELNFALQLGLKHSHDGLVFIITDNKNDFNGTVSDREFYTMLAGDAGIHSVYFVPLAQPDSTEDALVLYGIASGKGSRDILRSVVSDFASAVKSEAVQFRPLFEQEKGHPQLGLSQNISEILGDGDEQPADLEGDSIVVNYEEGHPLDAVIRFKLHSNLKHWRIINGHLTQAQVAAEVPREFLGAGPVALPVNVRQGKTLNINPGGDSVEVYSLPLSGLEDSGVALRRAGLFQTSLPDIHVMVHLNALIALALRPEEAGLQPVFSKALQQRMRAVRNLPEIMNAMTFQNDAASDSGSNERAWPVTREIIIRVRPDGVKNALARFILYILPLLVLAAALAGGFALFSRRQFTLVDPAGRSRVLEFSFFAKVVPLQWEGKAAARIKKTGNGLEIVPERGFAADPQLLPLSPSRFELTNKSSGERGQFQLRPGIVSAKSNSQGGSV